MERLRLKRGCEAGRHGVGGGFSAEIGAKVLHLNDRIGQERSSHAALDSSRSAPLLIAQSLPRS